MEFIGSPIERANGSILKLSSSQQPNNAISICLPQASGRAPQSPLQPGDGRYLTATDKSLAQQIGPHSFRLFLCLSQSPRVDGRMIPAQQNIRHTPSAKLHGPRELRKLQ